MILPAVTLTDPWASLCVAGIKTLETRKGPILSGFSGPLVIHRSRAPCVRGSLDYETAEAYARMIGRPQPWPWDDAGMALGVVFVSGTARLTTHGPRDRRMFASQADRPAWLDLPLADLRRRSCFDDIEGRYLSELTLAAWFPKPIPATGRQYRFKIDVPDEYLPGWARGAS